MVITILNTVLFLVSKCVYITNVYQTFVETLYFEVTLCNIFSLSVLCSYNNKIYAYLNANFMNVSVFANCSLEHTAKFLTMPRYVLVQRRGRELAYGS